MVALAGELPGLVFVHGEVLPDVVMACEEFIRLRESRGLLVRDEMRHATGQLRAAYNRRLGAEMSAMSDAADAPDMSFVTMLGTRQVAERLGVSVRHAHRLCTTKFYSESSWTGSSWRVPSRVVDEYARTKPNGAERT